MRPGDNCKEHDLPYYDCIECLRDEVKRLREGNSAIHTLAIQRGDRAMRDRAVGALGVLVHDGVISSGRMRELLGMSIMEQREEVDRILNEQMPYRTREEEEA